MQIPGFSIFSAVSELFVTAGVLYVVLRNWGRRRFSFPIFLAVVLFEGLVNVLYMSRRASMASADAALPQWMRLFYALHGVGSLFAYIVFVVLGVFAHQDQKKDRWYFREHPGTTWAFLVLWVLSIGSGEAIFALRYLAGR